MSENLETNQTPETQFLNQDLVKKKNKFDFWLGLIGGLVVNAILIMLSQLNHNAPTSKVVNVAVAWLPWIVNLCMIIAGLAMKRPKIVTGILTVYAIPIALMIVGGVIFMVICFVAGGVGQL